MKYKLRASHHAATCFLNSLLMEWDKFEKHDTYFSLQLPYEQQLIIPVKRISAVGRHQYEGTFFIRTSDEIRKIDFEELTNLLSAILGQELQLEEGKLLSFRGRVKSSTRNVEHFLRVSESRYQQMFLKASNFIQAEQSLFAGHALHPTPKDREQFDESDLAKFSPETGSLFPLTWYFLARDCYYQKSSKDFDDQDWISEMFREDNPGIVIPAGFVALPVHPWQMPHLLKQASVAEYIKTGKMIAAPLSKRMWHPTSSLRTLYAPDCSYMLKFSLNLKLTNSIRHLLLHELERGLKLQEVFQQDAGLKFIREHPEFVVIHEPVFGAIADESGLPITESLFMGRLNPFAENAEALVVATLTQDHPQFEGSLAQTYITRSAIERKRDVKSEAMEWFKLFLKVAIRPLLKAQSDYGILLGAHQQNMILELRNSRPFKCYFRDCHGTGYSELAKALFQGDLNVLPKEESNFLFGYYVIINTTFNMISAIAGTGVEEVKLLFAFQKFLGELRAENPVDPSFLNYLLESEYLWHKGNFFCTLRQINENTERNPLSIYTKIKNPVWGVSHA